MKIPNNINTLVIVSATLVFLSFLGNYPLSDGSDEALISKSYFNLDLLIPGVPFLSHWIFSALPREDHINPVMNVLFWAMGHITVSSYGLKAFSILFTLIAICLALQYLNQTNFCPGRKAVFLAALFCNAPIVWPHLQYHTNFSWVLLLQMAGLFILRSGLDKSNVKTILLFIIIFLGTFSFENFFIFYGFLAARFFWELKDANQRTLLVLRYGIQLLPLIGYFFVHFQLFGSILPDSRLRDDLGYLASTAQFGYVVFSFLDVLSFGFLSYTKGIGNYSFLLLLGLGFGVLLIRLILLCYQRCQQRWLLYACLLSFIMIFYTGRYHPGLWTFNIMVAMVLVIECLPLNVRLNFRCFIILSFLLGVASHGFWLAYNSYFQYSRDHAYFERPVLSLIDTNPSNLLIVDSRESGVYLHATVISASVASRFDGSALIYRPGEMMSYRSPKATLLSLSEFHPRLMRSPGSVLFVDDCFISYRDNELTKSRLVIDPGMCGDSSFSNLSSVFEAGFPVLVDIQRGAASYGFSKFSGDCQLFAQTYESFLVQLRSCHVSQSQRIQGNTLINFSAFLYRSF